LDLGKNFGVVIIKKGFLAVEVEYVVGVSMPEGIEGTRFSAWGALERI